ncbi:hypothetical protein ABH933_001225 [Nocardia sp. GP40]|uniref:hypothetical protein n=1 Tax=Nocardia sp. GP40 TaxID=3156268 RepID=UPI003D2611BC
MHDNTSDTDTDTDQRTASLRRILTLPAATPERVLRWLCQTIESADLYRSFARQADLLALEQQPGTRAAQFWHRRATEHHHRAAAERTRAELLRDHIGGLPPRSHTHEFNPHTQRCACGITRTAARTLDPDYVTACCGRPIGHRLDVTASSRDHCFTCRRARVPIIHRDQWPPNQNPTPNT